jgi:predicted KAP-like P-loop ATPase
MLLEDIPAPDPEFGYLQITKNLLAVLSEPRTGAFVLGIHGPWGSGKTTVLHAMRSQILAEPSNIVVEFNAWKYHERETLARALIIQVLEKLRQQSGANAVEIQELEKSLYVSFTVREKGALRVDWGAAATETLLLAMRIGTANMLPGPLDRIGDWLNRFFNRKATSDDAKTEDVAKSIERAGKILSRDVVERSVQQVISVEQFLSKFRDLVAKLALGKRVYILIDDLDRCLPDSALEVFEAAKLFMDAPEWYLLTPDHGGTRIGRPARA